MINYKEEIAKLLNGLIEGMEYEEILSIIEVPTDEKMGDYAFPCFKLAKILRKAPPAIAGDLADRIQGNPLFRKVESVNAYLNMFMSREEFAVAVLQEVMPAPEKYGRSDIGQNRKVIVEFSSPNIAKPFHIGHIRSTVIGNAIYKIYDCLGYDTVRINHLGDYGTQFGKMIVAYRRWGNKEDVVNAPIETLLSYYVKFHEEVEKDPELDIEARAAFSALEKGAPEEMELWQWFREESLKEFSKVYKLLNIEFDSYAGESFYSEKMDRFVKELDEKGLLKESNGARIVDLEQYGLPPALITKSDGSTLYITRDIAAAVYRKEHYDFYKNLYIVGNQQLLHFQQWIKIVELLGYQWARDCIHIPFGLVSLEDGDALSTRKGKVVFLEDVLKKAVEKTREIIIEKNVNTDNIDETAAQVGIGAVIFNELSNSREKDYVFSWDKVLTFDGETGPYVQYTHARACSIMRNAGTEAVKKAMDISNIKAGHISSESAFRLAKLIYGYPEAVVEAGERYEPSFVARHIVDVAQAFNRLYHDEHILVDNEEEKISKLALIIAAKTVINNGLGLLGVHAPEKM